MPKRKRSKQKKLHFSDAEHLLIGLEKIYKSGSEDARTAHSLAQWWLEHKSWTSAQWMYAKSLVAKSKKKKVTQKPSKYHVYAVSDGEFVKIGFSNNIQSRIKSMQTGHPRPLKCIWKYYAGDKMADAKRMEGKLHRYCRKHRVRGEWFSAGCIPMVEKFSAGNDKKKREIEDDLDRKLLLDSPI